ncbi:hypothetical protein [Psittacicella hinzii]|uniref:Uncharacterized protein n=1 Tax=Psittacicella hinzii TaxID=2028575 RepID=A0A3A1YGJ9_9GAMM|nr:hypothetical protein [Psittacicella hinzii]RIY36200.1 hypothetical protein CKF58_06055 [Psittacicella hinzii]
MTKSLTKFEELKKDRQLSHQVALKIRELRWIVNQIGQIATHKFSELGGFDRNNRPSYRDIVINLCSADPSLNLVLLCGEKGQELASKGHRLNVIRLSTLISEEMIKEAIKITEYLAPYEFSELFSTERLAGNGTHTVVAGWDLILTSMSEKLGYYNFYY